MLNGWPQGGVWLSTQPTDMRKSFDGLSALVKNQLRDDPLSGRWYVFINRRRTILKILAWDAGGYWVWAKRLEEGLFASRGSGGVRKTMLSRTELLALVDGLDMKVVRRRKRWIKGPASQEMVVLT